MTYALAEPLQTAVYNRLASDGALTSLVNQDIYDAPMPLDPATSPPDYITIGSEAVRDRGSKTSDGALHDVTIVVHSNANGYVRSKEIAAAICDALLDANLSLSRGKVVYLRFLKARADAAGAPVRRKISLIFRAFVEDS